MDPSRVERLPAPLPILFAILAVLWTVPPEVHPLGSVLACGLLCALALVLVPGTTLSQRESRLLLLLAIPLLLSFPVALDRGAAVDRLVLLGGAAVVFLAGRRLAPAAARGAVHLVIAGGSLLALYGIWQAAFGLPFLLSQLDPGSPLAGRLSTGRVFSRFLLPSAFASFLLLALPPAVAAWRGGRRPARLAALAAAAAMALALLLTRSHGALAALTATAILWQFMARGRRRIPTLVALLALLLGLGLVVWSRGGALLSDVESQGPGALRWRNAGTAVAMLADRPVLGLGGGGFGAAYPAYRAPGDNETQYVHNSYLQLLTEHGLTMAVPLTLALLAWGRRARAVLAGGTAAQRGLVLGVTAFLLHNLVEFSGLLPSTLWTAALLAGLAAGIPGPAARRLGPRSLARRRVPVTATLIGVLAIAAAGMAAGMSRQRLQEAQQQVLADDLPAALAASRRSAAWAPWRGEGHMLQAEILTRHPHLAAGQGGLEAWQAASRALARVPVWPAAYAVRAAAAARMGEPGLAAADLQRAIDLYPLAPGYARQLDELATRVAGAAGEVSP